MFLFYLLLPSLSVTAAPLRHNIARDAGNYVNQFDPMPYLGLVAVIVIFPLIGIGITLCLYRRRHGRYPAFVRKPIVGDPTAPQARPARQRYRRRGVWRAEYPEGLPRYTVEPRRSELSLGIGRKRTEEEDYELGQNDSRTSGEIARQDSGTSESSAGRNGLLVPPEPPLELLPPYMPPPPPPIYLSDGFSFGRAATNEWPRALQMQDSERRTSMISATRRSPRGLILR